MSASTGTLKPRAGETISVAILNAEHFSYVDALEIVETALGRVVTANSAARWESEEDAEFLAAATYHAKRRLHDLVTGDQDPGPTLQQRFIEIAL